LKILLKHLARQHKIGIALRNIHPRNILISSQGNVDISNIDSGSMAYYSPEVIFKLEQNENEDVFTAENDIWSFGCILFEMALGYIPLAAESYDSLLQ
jgi:serine/threonine protein kinase